METYVYLVAILNFLVDFFLLLGTNRLAGHPLDYLKTALAALIGGIYGGVCMVPGFHFLGNTLWRLVSLGLISWAAFGSTMSALRRGILFALLQLALTGIAAGMDGGGFWSVVAAAAGICLMCAVGFRDRPGGRYYVPVELSHAGQSIQLTALQDTGNTLRDPVTGQSVLVVGADVANKLTGLTREQLRSPVEVMTAAPLPGLRLIPYHTVGQSRGMLLALRLQNVKIGSWRGSSLVAFAPEWLSKDGEYQALTGGAA